ncbi:hypothetical protein ROZALSC1DRAFT_27907, partial [Rozella allomycis CSF55]
ILRSVDDNNVAMIYIITDGLLSQTLNDVNEFESMIKCIMENQDKQTMNKKIENTSLDIENGENGSSHGATDDTLIQRSSSTVTKNISAETINVAANSNHNLIFGETVKSKIHNDSLTLAEKLILFALCGLVGVIIFILIKME